MLRLAAKLHTDHVQRARLWWLACSCQGGDHQVAYFFGRFGAANVWCPVGRIAQDLFHRAADHRRLTDRLAGPVPLSTLEAGERDGLLVELGYGAYIEPLGARRLHEALAARRAGDASARSSQPSAAGAAPPATTERRAARQPAEAARQERVLRRDQERLAARGLGPAKTEAFHHIGTLDWQDALRCAPVAAPRGHLRDWFRADERRLGGARGGPMGGRRGVRADATRRPFGIPRGDRGGQ